MNSALCRSILLDHQRKMLSIYQDLRRFLNLVTDVQTNLNSCHLHRLTINSASINANQSPQKRSQSREEFNIPSHWRNPKDIQPNRTRCINIIKLPFSY